MTTIHKFKAPSYIELHEVFDIEMDPAGKVVHVAAQNNVVCIWAEVDADAAKRTRRFILVPTGGNIPPWACHQGTFIVDDIVIHVFGESSE